MSDNQESEKKADYTILREQLSLLAKEFKACDGVNIAIAGIIDKDSFKKAYKNTFEQISEKFDIEIYGDDEDGVDDLREFSNELETELKEYKKRYGELNSVVDELKADIFTEHINNYTFWELQTLLQNGREFLKQKS